MVGTIVFVLIIIGVLYFCMSLFRNRKPKVTEFQLAELLEKCKEDPGQFLEEYKNTPVFVIGTVAGVRKAQFKFNGRQVAMLNVAMKVGEK